MIPYTDFNEFMAKWDSIAQRNLDDGFPQLNSIAWVCRRYPDLRGAIEKATLALAQTHYSKESISEWIRLYKIPCTLLRHEYLEAGQPLEQTLYTRKLDREGTSKDRNTRLDIQQEKLF